jgi:hypothetical protein
MGRLAGDYEIPPELDAFIDSGFLQLLSEKPGEKTLEFHIPSKVWSDDKGNVSAYSIVWIHPAHNAQFCHLYQETPGDLPNFYVSREFDHAAPDSIDDLDSVDDLVDWLIELRDTGIAR